MNRNTGISYIDSTKIEVCGKKRMKSNKVFKKIAEIGKTTTGYFFGFKVHLVINHVGDILSFCLTKGNVDDRTPIKTLTKRISGRLFGDKGYIGKELKEELLKEDIELVTTVRKNMKPQEMSLENKQLLRKRSIIETVNDQLKNISQIEHTRHRSPLNFIVNLLGGLAAYTLKDNKPSINLPSYGLATQ
jgi:hypothetical protein